MSIELSKDDKKSLAITTVVYALLLLLLFLLRFWPPSDMKMMGGGGGGVEMNFGDSDFGLGDNYQSEVLNVKDQAQVEPNTTSPEDNIISDDNNDDDTNVSIPKKDIKKTLLSHTYH